ncbi:MAG: cell division protein FtsX [Alphaproteobacteria bacterium]
MKRRFFKRNDIDFTRDDIHRFLPWLIAVMACLTTLLLSLTISIHSWIDDRHHNYAANFTVNIPARVTEESEISRIVSTIKGTAGIQSVRRVQPAELHAVMEQWLGNSDIGQLPLPTVLEVLVKEDAMEHFDHAALQDKMNAVVSGVEVDAHETWVKAFASFSSAVSIVLIALSMIIVTAMASAVIFTARTALKLHSKSVALLHSIGAHDMYITRQFQQDAFLTSLPGLIGGTFAAAGLYWASGSYVASLPASLPSFAIQGGHIALFILLPMVCSMAVVSVTRMAILSQLRQTL